MDQEISITLTRKELGYLRDLAKAVARRSLIDPGFAGSLGLDRRLPDEMFCVALTLDEVLSASE